MENLKKQLTIYYIFNFINRFMVYFPVFVLFLNHKGFNQQQIMALMTAYNISILLGELPTGIVADRFSRKYSVIIGCLLQGASMLLMVFLKSFYGFVIIEILFGIGITFQSGAITSLMYDYLKEMGREDIFAKTEGRKWSCVFFAQGTASILGGFIAQYDDISLTIVITSIAYVLSALVLIPFKETKVVVNKEVKYVSHFFETCKIIIGNKSILTMLVIIMFTDTLFQTTMWLYQPYYQAIGLPIQMFGVIYFLMSSISAVGGLLSGKLNLSKKGILAIYIAGNLVSIALMGAVHNLLGVVLPILLFFIMGLVNPWMQKYWESEISSSQRATASSISSFATSLLFAAAAVPIGYIKDNWNVFSAFQVPSIIYTLFLLVFLVMLKVKKTKKNVPKEM